MKKIILLSYFLFSLFLCSCSSTSINTEKQNLNQTPIVNENSIKLPGKINTEKHFTNISKSAILSERFTYTDYFSDTKSIQIDNSGEKLYVWGSIKAEKGAFEVTIQNPEGKKVFTKTYNNSTMTTLDLNFPAIKGKWTFNVTCYNTKGEYQIMAEQL